MESRDGRNRLPRAAALGGYTAVVAMPNTEPAIDSAVWVREVQQLGDRALCDVRPAGAISVGRSGEASVPMAEMAELGVRLFTDDGAGLQDDGLMRRAMEYAGGLRQPVVLAHREVNSLGRRSHARGCSVQSYRRAGHPGGRRGGRGARLRLGRLTRTRLHFQHLSTGESLRLVDAARADGLGVTAEVAPHHFTLTDAEVESYDPVFGESSAATGHRRGSAA